MCPKLGRVLCQAEGQMVKMSGMFRRLLDLLKRAAPSLRSLLLCRSHSSGHLEMTLAVSPEKTELSQSPPGMPPASWDFLGLPWLWGEEEVMGRKPWANTFTFYFYFVYLYICSLFFLAPSLSSRIQVGDTCQALLVPSFGESILSRDGALQKAGSLPLIIGGPTLSPGKIDTSMLYTATGWAPTLSLCYKISLQLILKFC